MIKLFARVMSAVSAIAGILLAVRFPPGLAGGIAWLPKLFAGAWAPLVGLAGIIGALLGLARRDRFSIGAGLVGAAAAIRYVVRVTAPQRNQLAAVEWNKNLPLARYKLIQPDFPSAQVRRNLTIPTPAGKSILADLWQPPAGVKPNRVGILYLHGSTWQAMGKGVLVASLFNRLANQGYTMLDLAYSLAPQADLQNVRESEPCNSLVPLPKPIRSLLHSIIRVGSP